MASVVGSKINWAATFSKALKSILSLVVQLDWCPITTLHFVTWCVFVSCTVTNLVASWVYDIA